MKQFINAPEGIVREGLRAHAGRPGMALLAEHDVLVRTDAPAAAVAVVSGGGAGHEPAHAGYVGEGMLAAAVAGPVFTSPSVDAILAGLRAVAGAAGVLLIVKNYTGDRLNFGIAAELLRAEGLAVETVVVADDVAIDRDGDHAGRRGIAGTVLVHKIAGAVAASGASLAEVAAAARAAADGVRSMGVSLDSCSLPGAAGRVRPLAPDEIEWGLGIHGEPGMERGAPVPADAVVDRLLSRIVDDLGGGAQRCALLVKSLGATPSVETDVVLDAALRWLAARGHVVERAWAGAFLTALDTPGVSISLLPVDEPALAALDADTAAPAWPRGSGRVAEVRELRVDAPAAAAATAGALPADAPIRARIEAVAAALIAAEQELTDLDSAVGDGDLGTSLARGSRAVLAEIDALPDGDGAVLRRMSEIIRRAIGGTSGPLYAAGLLRAAAVLDDTGDWAAAFRAGVAAIGALGGARQGDATMLDALIPAAEAVVAAAPEERLAAAVAAARSGADSTIAARARLGRASYLGDRAVGVIDPGARAVVIWLDALAATPADGAA